MSETHLILLLLAFCVLINLVGLVVLWLRKPDAEASQLLRQELAAAIFQGNERLERELRRMTGVTVERDAWQWDQVPDHLKITFRVVDDKNKKLQEGRVLQDLKDALNRVFVEVQNPSHGPIAIRGVLVDHGIDKHEHAS